MANKFRGYDLDENGNIRVCPLVGYAAFVPFGTACGLRLEYAPSEERIDSPESVQLIMTPEKARELAGVLLDIAARAMDVSAFGEAKN